MKSARRVPRKVGADEEEEAAQGNNSTLDPASPVVVKRPGHTSRSRAKKSSALRASFNPPEEEDAEYAPAVLRPERKLGRQVIERNVHARRDRASDLPLRATSSLENRPSYSSDYLIELKSSTQNTPRPSDTELSDSAEQTTPGRVDVGAKFGDSALALSQPAQNTNYHIPTETEIREKKERRRRLASEQDYISLNDVDSPRNNESNDDSETEDPRNRSLIIQAEELDQGFSKYGETRLVHEDEDIAEGFEEFVEDAGKVALGHKAAKQQERDRRKEIEEQIRAAQRGRDEIANLEGGEEASEDEEEIARNAAYEAAQTRAGTYGMSTSRGKEQDKEYRLKKKLEMPKVKLVPDFKSVIARFADMVAAKEHQIQANRKRLDMLEKERAEIEEDEVRMKQLLEEAGERYEVLRAKTPGQSETSVNGHGHTGSLENVSTPHVMITDASEHGSNVEQHDVEDTIVETSSIQDQHHAPVSQQGLSGMAQIAHDEDDYY